ncbi:MAG TPA: crosslink repair DNA glycosylase YcaQ family protein [Acidimicrobiia bacterium]|nr:crosslink repair DNA glycosylase YcaQ family protein [Acidimicrobiia bacterium]
MNPNDLRGGKRLDLSRQAIVTFRRRTQGLDERLPPGPDGLRRAAWAGLQDSVPRSALHSLHARVQGIGPDAWEDAALVQVWGLRFAAYVVPADDHALFTVARLPESGQLRRRSQDIADRLHELLEDRRLDAREAASGLGIHPNELRYGAMTGTILIRWDGARQPLVWTVPPPDVDPDDARLELARRYLHFLGPGTPTGFGSWAGIKPPRAAATFDALASSLLTVSTPHGDAFLLASDEPVIRADDDDAPAPARLLPSGDTFCLLHGVFRELLVPDAEHRAALWPSRVWPGAVLVGGDVVGTWRRSRSDLTVEPWRPLTPSEREAVESEAASLPLPGVAEVPSVRWPAA